MLVGMWVGRDESNTFFNLEVSKSVGDSGGSRWVGKVLKAKETGCGAGRK
jgi:hypothetical protein